MNRVDSRNSAKSQCGFTSVILARPHVGAVCRCILVWWLSIRRHESGNIIRSAPR
jgi:hypothetical protein